MLLNSTSPSTEMNFSMSSSFGKAVKIRDDMTEVERFDKTRAARAWLKIAMVMVLFVATLFYHYSSILLSSSAVRVQCSDFYLHPRERDSKIDRQT